MVKYKIPTSGDIESIKFITRSFTDVESKKILINQQANKFQITDEFMSEFGEYIARETFSSSPMLSFDIIRKYTDKFDIDSWIISTNKSLDPLMHDEFFNLVDKDKSYVVNEAINNADKNALTVELFDKFKLELKPEARSIFVNSSKLSNNEEFLLENINLINSKLFLNKDLTIKFTNALIEKILENKKLISLSFVIELLSHSSDLAFIKRMLEAEFDYVNNGDTNEYVMKEFINKFPEAYMDTLFNRIVKNNRNLLSYDVLEYILKMKDNLTEQFLLENVELFKSNGLVPELAKYAREREYNSVLINLKLSN